MDNIQKKLTEFIDNTPNAYYCVANIKRELEAEGYKELYENEEWKDLKNGKYFVIRNDASLIAFNLVAPTKKLTGFSIVAAHGDSPSFSIKTNPEMNDGKYAKLNVGTYGGMINYSWLDRPLSIAGRVITLKDGIYESHLVNIPKDLLVIPSQAIHINRDVNDKNHLNRQVDMLPIISLDSKINFESVIRDELARNNIHVDKICDYDLYLYNRDRAIPVGLEDELILAPRLDDLAALYPSLKGFLEATNDYNINVFCAFNSEEIGSSTKEGADSSFLFDCLTRIANAINLNLHRALSNSFIISADNAHATHPNAGSKNDPTNIILLNKGIVIKHHPNYTTNGLSSALFKGICDNASVPYQDYACRSDMACGATLGAISQSHVSIDSVDIGLPQLAMHSANETIGARDVLYMYKSILEFYNSTIVRDKGRIRIYPR